MPKLPILSAKELVKIFEKAKYSVVRQKAVISECIIKQKIPLQFRIIKQSAGDFLKRFYAILRFHRMT